MVLTLLSKIIDYKCEGLFLDSLLHWWHTSVKIIRQKAAEWWLSGVGGREEWGSYYLIVMAFVS